MVQVDISALSGYVLFRGSAQVRALVKISGTVSLNTWILRNDCSIGHHMLPSRTPVHPIKHGPNFQDNFDCCSYLHVLWSIKHELSSGHRWVGAVLSVGML